MAATRPYFKLGIADIESIFEAARADKVICLALIEELGYRKTERATVLLRRVRAAMSEIEMQRPRASIVEPEILTNATASTADSTQRYAGSVPLIMPKEVVKVPLQRKALNEPAAILAAWTALEALSPQTYRRPADLVNGDRRCVAQFEGNGFLP